MELLQKLAVERVQDPGTPGFYSWLLLVVIDLTLLNQYIKKQLFKMETVKSVQQSILIIYWAVSIDLTDAYLHVPIHPRSWFHVRNSGLPIHGLTFNLNNILFVYTENTNQNSIFVLLYVLPFGMSLWIFTKLMAVIAAHLHQRALSLFPCLDDWLIRDLIRKRLILHNILPSNSSKSRVHSKSKEVRFDTSSAIQLHRDGISDTTQHSQGTSRSHRIPTFVHLQGYLL